MTLDILVTHYKEPLEVCKPLFESLACQRGIDFNDVTVTFVNDGEDGAIECADRNYPFHIDFLTKEHGGVSAARNYALDNSDSDYVMWCDCDDAFLNGYGLYLVFSAMQEDYDAITSCFVEEQRTDDGNYRIFRHDKDCTFIHGKVYKRDFLVRNDIRFRDDLTIHEDGYFNTIALTVAEKKKEIETPFYLWCWNENSVVRKDRENFTLKTYDHVIKQRLAITEEFEKRGFITESVDCVCKTFLNAYYDFNKPECLKQENADLVRFAEKQFKKYYKKYGGVWRDAAVKQKAEAAMLCRTTAYTNGLLMESMTITEWLRHISKEVN